MLLNNKIIMNDKDNLIHRSVIEDGAGLFDKFDMGTKTRVIIREGKKILYDGSNTTVLGGRISLLEKHFDIVPNIEQHLTLNTILGIPHSQTQRVFTDDIKRSTLYFMAGEGAASAAVPGKIASPHNYETKLYGSIPFRLVPASNDISESEQDKYRFRRLETHGGVDYIGYYAKKFDPGVLHLEYNDASYIPLETDTVPVDENDASHRLSGGSVLAFVQFTLEIDQNELKEYFRVKNGSLTNASMSEIGLVMGADLVDPDNYNRRELAAAELFAKVTSSAIPMDQEGNQRVVEYRIYAR